MKSKVIAFPIICIFLFIINSATTAQLPYNTSWYKDYDVKFYFIALEVNDTSRFIAGHTTMLSVADAKIDTFFLEMGNHLIIDSLQCNNQKANFSRKNDVLGILLPSLAKKGEKISVVIYYHGLVPASGFFSALTNREDTKWKIPVTWTVSESFASKDWFPCKQYLPDKADSAYIFLTVPKNRMAGSNGKLTATTPIVKNKMRYEWKTFYPVAYYLISFAVSDYQDYSFYVRFNDQDSLLMQNYVYNNPDYLTGNKSLIDKTGAIMAYFSSIFGPYPFIKEKYGHCLAPVYGGMENQTMTTLLNFDFNLVTHEMAHQWFGDEVTCSTWQDIWLNEGFASYAEYLALDKLDSHSEAQKWMKNAKFSALQDSVGSVFIPDSDKTNELRIFNSSLTYKKGAAIIHMLRYEIDNDTLFFKILRNYLTACKYSTAAAGDLLKVVNSTTHSDYSWFFNQWYFGKGYPTVASEWSQKHNLLSVTIRQKASACASPAFKMHMDLLVQYRKESEKIKIYLDKPVQTFTFPIKKTIKNIIPDPEGWCLQKLSKSSSD